MWQLLVRRKGLPANLKQVLQLLQRAKAAVTPAGWGTGCLVTHILYALLPERQ